MKKRGLMLAAAGLLLVYWGATYDGETGSERIPAPTTGQAAKNGEAGETESSSKDTEERRGLTHGLKNTYGIPERTKESRRLLQEAATDEERSNKATDKAPGEITATAAGSEAGNGLTSRGGSNLTSMGTFKITAYTAGYESTGKRPGDPAYGVTATGATVEEGVTIAADWNVLPPGTLVKIQGLEGYYTVQDRGGGVKGNHIDLYVSDLTEALEWGVRERKIWVKEWGK